MLSIFRSSVITWRACAVFSKHLLNCSWCSEFRQFTCVKIQSQSHGQHFESQVEPSLLVLPQFNNQFEHVVLLSAVLSW